MSLGRLFREELVKLELESAPEPLPEGVEPTPAALEKARWRFKERVCAELVGLFAASGEVRNEHKFLLDLVNRERKASTALGDGLAVPHVRSLQPRSTVVVFARSTPGVEFASPDGAPVHLFFGITAPSYADADYLKIYKWLATSFTREDWLRPALMSAEQRRRGRADPEEPAGVGSPQRRRGRRGCAEIGSSSAAGVLRWA